MTQRIAVGLTVLNSFLLVFLLAQMRPVAAQSVAPVLRGRALEIVDHAGKPVVKLETHEAGVGLPKGSGLGLLGDSDATQAFIGTEGATSKVEVKNRDGQRQQVRP